MTGVADNASILHATVSNLSTFQEWRGTGILVLILSFFALWLRNMASRPPLPSSAPELLKTYEWPIFGSWRFFLDRADFFTEAAAASKTGNFSFYIGKLHIIGVSKEESRKAFFDSKGLDLAAGVAAFIQSSPSIEAVDGKPLSEDPDFNGSFNRTMAHLLKGQNFGRNLDDLVSDVHEGLESAIKAAGGTGEGIIDTFEDMNQIIYRMTMRTFGATEIASDPALLRKTLRYFEITERSSSPIRLVIPWLPTLNHLRRMGAGAMLYWNFSTIVNERKKTGKKVDDAFQYLIDKGEDMTGILRFTLSALFAGQINTGINTAWILVYLALTPSWYIRVQQEVDAVVAKYRTSPSQAPVDVIRNLNLEQWENELASVRLCLRETIRLHSTGSVFRRNISGQDVSLGSSGEIVPKGSYVVYSVDDMHMNKEHYPEPARWDPARYEGGNDPPYMGWGLGRHPCPGMRFAKLEVMIIVTMFVTMFDFGVVDEKGRKTTEVPERARNAFTAVKPDVPVRLAFKTRQ
ncbi:hypothetical protein MCOR25_001325 [Pyricularia grisea]|uniref:Uncharacterized protein n=1 Tax=Pyricularia grisea TaxID=148305 RepID=A0A6P8B1H5_PYRGI|nr:uncharacterized protein PgNI_07628 [Pyricularia grisea]KAI6381024.1 hypothetical protein MCOR25_001325 [Pyricularia grisea]TLD08707.1 hypothetical protein PgNI_07628 [Pyricularia grisea]